MKHSNVAIFVPHNGCPHQCSFCNQKEITGQRSQPTAEDVRNAAEIAIRSLGERSAQAEIAFFGGSFTAIDREYMKELLGAAEPYVENGLFYGIRLSTRPDAIDKEILDILKESGVTSIELGAQSMDDDVLIKNERGHSAEDVVKASRLIHEYGFSLGLQMMTGLYGSDNIRDRETAIKIADLEPDTVRIYPTVILKGSKLYHLYESGAYVPPTLDETVSLCADLLRFFGERKITVIRLGLHDSDSLRENMAAGVFHPALRELCESRMMLDTVIEMLSRYNTPKGDIVLCVNPRSVSRMTGQKKSNIREIERMGYRVRIETDDLLEKYQVILK